jgi:hypothetical protein
VLQRLKESGKEIILITEDQVTNFVGNMLQVHNSNEERFLLMSDTAYKALTRDQITKIEKHCKILATSLTTIETYGGGSARCMIAEIFLPKK